jgi:hypothetical protein
LTDAVPFRNYLALTHIGPFAQNYIVSSDGRRWPLVAAYYDANGALQLSFGGDLAQEPSQARGEQPEITRAVEGELARLCPDVRFRVRFAGAFRRLHAKSFTPTTFGPGTMRGGRFSDLEILADETLERHEAVSYHHSDIRVFSAWGRIEVPETTRWVSPALTTEQGLEAGASMHPHSLILAAARSAEAGIPGPRLADVPIKEPERLLVSGEKALAHLVLNFGVKHPRSGRPGRAVLPLEVAPAVFGPESSAETEVDVGKSTFIVRAKISPEEPRRAEPKRAELAYRGELKVQIFDSGRVVFERGYPVTGDVVTMGSEAASTYALMIPGGTCPSRECELVKGTVEGKEGEMIGFSVGTQMTARAPH